MRHTLGVYLRLIGVQIRSQMQYRLSFWTEAITTGLNIVGEFGSLALVLTKFGSIGGWTLPEVAFLYGITEIAFALMDMVFSGFDPQRFGQRIRLGEFDRILLRPVSPTVQVLGLEFLMRRLGRVVTGAGIFIYALALNPIQWTAVKAALVLVSLVSMFIFFGGLFIIGATITFWTVDSIELMNTLTYGGSYTISHPMHIYPNWLRHFFTYLVPAIFLNYFPALYILGKPDPLGFPAFAPLLAPIAAGLMFLLALKFWHFGMRAYQSTGT